MKNVRFDSLRIRNIHNIGGEFRFNFMCQRVVQMCQNNNNNNHIVPQFRARSDEKLPQSCFSSCSPFRRSPGIQFKETKQLGYWNFPEIYFPSINWRLLILIPLAHFLHITVLHNLLHFNFRSFHSPLEDFYCKKWTINPTSQQSSTL